LSGGSMKLLVVLAMLGILAGSFLYVTKPHVASRVDRFMDPSTGDTYQVDRAMDAIRAGGVTGVGLGDGRVKSILPDAHSDYVFAVAAEEGGLWFGTFIILAFGFLIWRALNAMRQESEHWIQLAASGLICLFGLQATINLAVNLNLMPSKGMTLPFVSYGGSSLLASAITMGMLVGLMRRRSSSSVRMAALSPSHLPIQMKMKMRGQI
jgi:cell division protein FtsW